MGNSDVPETIDMDWDRFYLEYPDIYDRFALTSVAVMPTLRARYSLDGAVVLDAGSGTGKSTFELAKHARLVVGLKPWDPMREYAIRQQRASGVRNVAFVRGAVEGMPFRPQSLDHVVSVFGFPFWFVEAGAHGRELGRRFVADCHDVVKPGGWVIAVAGASDHYAGELTPIVVPAFLDRERPRP